MPSTPYEPFFGGRYPSEPFREEDAEPQGRSSAHALRDQKYRYHARAIREPFDQFGRVVRSTSQRGLSVDYPNYQNHAPHHPPFDQFNGRRDGASYYGDRAAAAGYNHWQLSDVPSMVESETSSVENTWDEDLWNNGKIAAAAAPSVVNSSRGRYSEEPQYESHHHLHAVAKKPAAALVRSSCSRLPVTRLLLPVTKVAFSNMNKDSSSSSGRSMIEVSPGQFLLLRGAEETWRAIACDFYMPCACACCSLTLFCIQDACFVLCPDCRVISPMLDHHHHHHNGITFEGFEGGVGLGFTMEDLRSGKKI